MSRSGQPVGGAIMVVSLAMSRGDLFDWHDHPTHQLAWAARGVLTVTTVGGAWVLPPSRALWIPAGTPHATGAESPADLRSLYLPAELGPADWVDPTAVTVRPLLRELVVHLAQADSTPAARARAEAVLLDLLEPVPVSTVRVRMPTDDRATGVATALLADPADGRTLAAWGRSVGASGRTLARVFVAETGSSFGHWRTQVRLRASLPLLAEGTPVATVARRVGYATSSAFVAAFRRTVGVSPGAYFNSGDT